MAGEWSWNGVNLGEVRGQGEFLLSLPGASAPTSRRRRLDGSVAVQVGIAASDPFDGEFYTDDQSWSDLLALVGQTDDLTGPGGVSVSDCTLVSVSPRMLIGETDEHVTRLRWEPG